MLGFHDRGRLRPSRGPEISVRNKVSAIMVVLVGLFADPGRSRSVVRSFCSREPEMCRSQPQASPEANGEPRQVIVRASTGIPLFMPAYELNGGARIA